MEDFLHQKILIVEDHIAREYPKEICGVLAGTKKNIDYFPCKNIADDDDEFIIDPKDYIKISLTKTIVAIVHSHNGPCEPSQWDIQQCNAIKIPFIIYGTDGIKVLYPEKQQLKGRLYKFGKHDCFEAVRDWFIYKDIFMPPRHEDWIDDWYDEGFNYIEDSIHEWNLSKVQDGSLRYGDVLVFKVFASVPDHIGVYEGNDKFFHHANGRISSSENLWKFWGKYLVGVYRNEAHNFSGHVS